MTPCVNGVIFNGSTEMAEAKRLVGVQRLSLEGFGDGWGDECYALYAPASYADTLEINDLDVSKLTKREQIEVELKMVRDHFVGGKIKAYTASGEQELSDMTEDDAVATIAIADAIYAAIMGFDFDPKDMRRAVVANALHTNNATSTETSLSETSPTNLIGEPTES